MHILIIGAGIGGLCLGQALKKAGISFAIYERNVDSASWLEGYRIHVNPVGSQSLHGCLPETLWQAFLAGTADVKEGFGFLTEQLEELVHIDESLMVGAHPLAQHGQYAMSRILLRKILLVGLEDHLYFNKRFERYAFVEQTGVHAFFADGTQAWGDVLVGADGANSVVRKQLLPQAQRVETDAIALAGRTRLTASSRQWIPPVLQAHMNVVMAKRKFFFFSAPFDHQQKLRHANPQLRQAMDKAGLSWTDYIKANEDYVLWSFITHRNELATVSQTEDLRPIVVDKMAGWHPQLKQLVNQADESSLTRLAIKTMLPIQPWVTSRVTMLGDAVHNMPPLYGMGANMAMHDALILQQKLIESSKGSPLLGALSEYEQIMLTTGFKAVGLAVGYTHQAISNNSLMRSINRTWFRLCTKFSLLKQLTFGNTWKGKLGDRTT
ncbi:FAD-dependent oxidoreductase [Spirosoma endbachense]|uniref:FAD-binding domain-containing protein n=1 Tax=Spirosoma endbachense TaxID=2666025 RepID=A0A6P1VR09_9BACT|nr:NAD(P)/FAD-dependent oxidoreductase [Spirosoma endbachense]QHV95691.1 hypothetical protein GJR95_12030 [Spirosoma endbachense]